MDFGQRDRFGVPASMFGQVDDDFYGLIGRVVMLGALLEDRLITLLTALSVPPCSQSTFAGLQARPVITKINKELEFRPASFAAHGRAVTADAANAFERRNAIVHSLWARPSLTDGWGHRTVTPSKRPTEGPDKGHFSVGTSTSETDLIALVGDLVDLYAAVRKLEDVINWPENTRLDVASA